jgi:hypothetical protein
MPDSVALGDGMVEADINDQEREARDHSFYASEKAHIGYVPLQCDTSLFSVVRHRIIM